MRFLLRLIFLLLLLLREARGPVSSQSSQNGVDVVPRRFCGVADRFCRSEGRCLRRETKCTEADSCDSSDCLAVVGVVGLFHFGIRWEPLPGVWGRLVSRLDNWARRTSRRRRRVIRLQHLQLIYRGFAYEFGQDYPAAEVDLADPHWPGAEGPMKVAGTSGCSRADVMTVVNWWNSAGRRDYHLTGHNCQDFGVLLASHLRSNCQVADQQHFAQLYAEAKASDPCRFGSIGCLRHLLGRLWPRRSDDFA